MGAILGDFCPILGSPRWLASSEFNHTWYVTSLLMGDYYCGVRKFWQSFVWSLWTKTHFWTPKSCLNDAITAIVLHQSNHRYFLAKVCSQRKVEVQYCNNRSLFPRVAACNLVICRHFDRFPPQGGNRIYRHCSCIQVRVSPTHNNS